MCVHVCLNVRLCVFECVVCVCVHCVCVCGVCVCVCVWCGVSVVCVCVCVCMCVCLKVCVCAYVCTYLCTHVCVYVWVHICVLRITFFPFFNTISIFEGYLVSKSVSCYRTPVILFLTHSWEDEEVYTFPYVLTSSYSPKVNDEKRDLSSNSFIYRYPRPAR